MPMRRAGVPAALLLALIVSPPVSGAKADQTAVARLAYNSGDYDAAVEAARAATADPKTLAEAQIVLGRALVERYRRSAAPQDLADARAALLAAGSVRLPPALQAEWLVGSAETLFFEEQYGAAAALLGSLLEDPRAGATTPGGRERLLDWWATAVDRAAQARDADARPQEYARLSERLNRELQRDPSLGTAAYWRVVAARGAGDLDRAWDAALAAWVRAPLAHDRGAELRADLDRIVTQAVIPERARKAGREEQETRATTLREQWEAFKQRWSSNR